MKKGKDYRLEKYFVGGKMKKRKISLIEGHEVEEFIRRNADDATLMEIGHYDLLHEREIERSQPRRSEPAGQLSNL